MEELSSRAPRHRATASDPRVGGGDGGGVVTGRGGASGRGTPRRGPPLRLGTATGTHALGVDDARAHLRFAAPPTPRSARVTPRRIPGWRRRNSVARADTTAPRSSRCSRRIGAEACRPGDAPAANAGRDRTTRARHGARGGAGETLVGDGATTRATVEIQEALDDSALRGADPLTTRGRCCDWRGGARRRGKDPNKTS